MLSVSILFQTFKIFLMVISENFSTFYDLKDSASKALCFIIFHIFREVSLPEYLVRFDDHINSFMGGFVMKLRKEELR